MTRRTDALNLGSFLVVLSLCLAITAYMGLRLLRVNPTHLAARLEGSVVTQAGARPQPDDEPVATQPLEVAAGVVQAAAAPPAETGPVPAQLPEVVSHGNRSGRMVALTFDSNMTTSMLQELDRGKVKRFVNDRVIAELRELRVPATFFLTGLWVDRYPDVARDLGADPLFEIGNHSYSHLGFRPNCFQLGTIEPARAADDIERNQTVLSGVTSHPTSYFRFPGGCYDAASLAAVRPTGMQVIQYDVASGDAFETRPEGIISHTVDSVRGGSIVVLHITGGNTAPVTDRALPEIVKQLRAKGFQLVRLSDLLQQGGAG